MGSPDFAVPGLVALNTNMSSQCTVVGVASNPDKRRGRGNKTSATPVKEKALALDIPVFDVDKTSDTAFHEWLKSLKPDLLVVTAFRILPKEVLAIPTIGSINVHASLLPKYRGAAPIHHAIMKGEKETGLTSFFLTQKMDAGKLILQEKISIGPDETTGEVYNRLMQLSGPFLLKTITKIIDNNLDLIEQDEDLASPAPKLFAEHCVIDWQRQATEVHNLIRGLSPFPGAYSVSKDGTRYNFIRSSLVNESAELIEVLSNLKVGETAKFEGKMLVKCGDLNGQITAVYIEELKPEGKRSMSGIDVLNGKPELQF
jgi:methionyl-tRNA formyltransferase